MGEKADTLRWVTLRMRLSSLILPVLIIISFLGVVPAHPGDLESRLGAEVAAQVEAEMGLVEHTSVSRFVEEIG